MQNASQKMHFRICNASMGCKNRNLLSIYGTPSKLLVTPNQQDHGAPGLKAKICSAIPDSLTVC